MAAKISIIFQSSKLFRVIMRIMSDLKASFGEKGTGVILDTYIQ